MKGYGGHRSWNQWNASLWLSSDYSLDSFVVDHIKAGHSKRDLKKELFIMIGNSRTPDGAIINKLAITNYVNQFNI